MAQRLVVHVGLMKSGTSFIQGRLAANVDVLAQQGISFPGTRWARQVEAVSDLIGGHHDGSGAWETLAAEIDAHPGTAVLSMEYLAAARREALGDLVARFPDTDLRIVVTVRDLGRSVPAQWQESIKNRAVWDWPEYVAGVRSRDEAGRTFWRQHAVDRIARRWASVAGVDHTVLVTVPPSGSDPELLWTRFAEVAGIEHAAWAPSARVNASLGAASTLVLRDLNLATPGLPQPKRRVKWLSHRVLSKQRGSEEPIGFSVPRWLHQEAARIVARLEKGGYPVVGDLADLEPADVPGVDPSTITLEQRHAAAVEALAELLRRRAPGG